VHKESLGINKQSMITDGKTGTRCSINRPIIPVEFIIVLVTNVLATLGINFIRQPGINKWRSNGKKIKCHNSLLHYQKLIVSKKGIWKFGSSGK